MLLGFATRYYMQSDAEDSTAAITAVKRKVSEHHARRASCVQLLYQTSINELTQLDSYAFQQFCGQLEVPEQIKAEIQQICDQVLQNIQKIDQLIESCCHNWKLTRINKVDLSILRLGTFELMADNVNKVEIISDYTAIGREFGTENTPGFINGVLDGMIEKLQTQNT